MKILLIVNQSPWDGGLGLTAWRLACAMPPRNHDVIAVFFRGDAVYTALKADQVEADATDLQVAWLEFSERYETPLLLCSTDMQRRMSTTVDSAFRVAGLPEVVALMTEADRVVTF